MTDLERVREELRRLVHQEDEHGHTYEGCPYCDADEIVQAIDAHLKEDAKREANETFVTNGLRQYRDELIERVEKAEAELTALGADRDVWRQSAEEQAGKYVELREAVREHLYRHHREGGATRLRQLIEDKP